MKKQQDSQVSINSPTDFYVPSEEKINELRTILEQDLNKVISYKDAQEIGIQLIGLYECLACDKRLLRKFDESTS